MKPERVIYYNELTQRVELCDKGNLALAKNITICDKQYVTKDVVEELLANNVFSVEEKKANDPLANVRFLLDMIEGTASPSDHEDGVRIEFIVKSRNSDRIDVETYCTACGRRNKFGDIIYKRTPTKIKNVTGDGSIELVNIDPTKAFTVGAAFGQFALGVGMYLFCKLDGKWSDEKKQEHDAALQNTKDLQSAIAKRKQEQLLLTQEIEAKKKELDAEVQKLEAKLNEQQKEIYYLEKEIAALEEGN